MNLNVYVKQDILEMGSNAQVSTKVQFIFVLLDRVKVFTIL